MEAAAMIRFADTYRTLNLAKVMARNPTLIGVVSGIRFYEHPIYGDEAGLIAVQDGVAYQTCWFDLPDWNELIG